MKKRQVRREEVKPGATFLVAEWTVRVIGPLYEDADGNPCTRELPGTTIRSGWWVVTGPNGPMRVRTRDFRLPFTDDAPGSEGGGR